MSLSTHVLDAGTGRPASGLTVTLEQRAGPGWVPVATARTDSDGRVRDFDAPAAGVHRLIFDTGDYFSSRGVATFYPQVCVVFEITDPLTHHHVPLLLSPFAYSTYRGS